MPSNSMASALSRAVPVVLLLVCYGQEPPPPVPTTTKCSSAKDCTTEGEVCCSDAPDSLGVCGMPAAGTCYCWTDDIGFACTSPGPPPPPPTTKCSSAKDCTTEGEVCCSDAPDSLGVCGMPETGTCFCWTDDFGFACGEPLPPGPLPPPTLTKCSSAKDCTTEGEVCCSNDPDGSGICGMPARGSCDCWKDDIGYACARSAGTGNTMTCAEAKELYRTNNCCGSPNRRLTATAPFEEPDMLFHQLASALQRDKASGTAARLADRITNLVEPYMS
eukprot:TRINITY_DN4295_c0_g1_i1.p1 TRINITY_DN4295_c0_g1~~TRINITY_DN4295_c0_g1_i1.p1  ORF type:complete len:275 (+),score=56.54 TRINITY_DN4295_c0_g1_i1:45-869(+)